MGAIGSIRIGNKKIGPDQPTYIIFEVASTHENNWQIAKNYVNQAKEVGANALKFQLFETEKLLNPISSIFSRDLTGILSVHDYGDQRSQISFSISSLFDTGGITVVTEPLNSYLPQAKNIA